MEIVPVYVGLDYHRKSVQVCVVDGAGRVLSNRKCGNSIAEIVGRVAQCCRAERVAVESCCGAADLAEHLHDGAGGAGLILLRIPVTAIGLACAPAAQTFRSLLCFVFRNRLAKHLPRDGGDCRLEAIF